MAPSARLIPLRTLSQNGVVQYCMHPVLYFSYKTRRKCIHYIWWESLNSTVFLWWFTEECCISCTLFPHTFVDLISTRNLPISFKLQSQTGSLQSFQTNKQTGQFTVDNFKSRSICISPFTLAHRWFQCFFFRQLPFQYLVLPFKMSIMIRVFTHLLVTLEAHLRAWLHFCSFLDGILITRNWRESSRDGGITIDILQLRHYSICIKLRHLNGLALRNAELEESLVLWQVELVKG